MAQNCQNCRVKIGVSKCAKCKVVRYCGKECQIADFSYHKGQCHNATTTLALVRNWEKVLRGTVQNDDIPHNVYVTHVGRFWKILDARSYLAVRYRYVMEIADFCTEWAFNEALEHGKDMLRLCRGDNLRVRALMPTFYLGLGTYQGMQDCYDFIKWWCTCDPEGHYDWDNVSLPYLNIKDADMCESIFVNVKNKGSLLTHSVAMTVIKMLLQLELQSFFDSVDTLLRCTVRQSCVVQLLRGNDHILTTIADYLWPTAPSFSTAALAKRTAKSDPRMKSVPSTAVAVRLRILYRALGEQVKSLLDDIETNLNPLIWKAIVNPDIVFQQSKPQYISHGSPEEIMSVIRECHPLFYGPFNSQPDMKDKMKAVRQMLAKKVGSDAPVYSLDSKSPAPSKNALHMRMV